MGSLSWQAMPDRFPRPDAVSLTLAVLPEDDEARAWLAAGADEVLLVRLIADGLPPQPLIHRLFHDQLDRGEFSEATAIVWTFSRQETERGTAFELVGSAAWIGPLRRLGSWSSDARPSAPDAED